MLGFVIQAEFSAMPFHTVVVFTLGYDFLFQSILGRCGLGLAFFDTNFLRLLLFLYASVNRKRKGVHKYTMPANTLVSVSRL